MTRRSVRLPLRRKNDAGVALLAVIGAMAMVTLFLVTALFVVLSNAGPARTSEDARTAYAAAQAGIDEYLARLNTTSGTYWTKGNNDPTNPALTATGPGQQVQGAGAGAARFRYQVLSTTEVSRTGRIRLQVTGISGPGQTGKGGVQKTLTATLSPTGFSKYVFFSDYSDMDPALMASPRPVTVNGSAGPSTGLRYAMNANDMCSIYTYEGRQGGFTLNGPTPAVGVWDPIKLTWTSAPGSVTSGQVAGLSCGDVYWTNGSIVDGPLHTNDGLFVNGTPQFKDVVESSWPYCKTNPEASCWLGGGTPAPPNLPKYAPPLTLPVSSGILKTVAQDDVMKVGCYYTGATSIKIVGDKMEVFSPNTTSAPSRCLNVASRSTTQTVDLPLVVYVDQVAGTCVNAGYPVAGEATNTGQTTDYTCNRGTAMVRGTVDGQVTIGTFDDLVVTGDLKYAGGETGDDVVGLIAGNSVWVYHPVDSAGNNLLAPTSPDVPYYLSASILALRHSFLMQNWGLGAPLTARNFQVFGSAAQRFTGPSGLFYPTTGLPYSGYRRDYKHDKRFEYLQPPFFLQPTDSPWLLESVTDG